MNKIFFTLLCGAALTLAAPAFAQQSEGHAIGKTIKKTSDTISVKTKRTVKKGTAKIVDKTYSNKVGPDGQTIYIDKNSRYYYIDKKGNKAYVKKAALRNKT